MFRLFAGVGGSACLTLGAGVIADLFEPQQRGKATSIWGVGPLIGPVAGPIAGGFLGEEVGWRWVFWVLLIVGGATALGIEILNRETYAPVIIRRKTAKLSKELGRTDLRSAYELNRGQASTGQFLKQSLVRPMLLLVKSPIVLLLSTYMSLIYGLLYLFFTTISSVFTEQYGFSTGLSGLAYLGIGVGFMLGLVFVAGTNDRIMLKLAARNGGKTEPEMRLPLMIIFSHYWNGTVWHRNDGCLSSYPDIHHRFLSRLRRISERNLDGDTISRGCIASLGRTVDVRSAWPWLGEFPPRISGTGFRSDPYRVYQVGQAHQREIPRKFRQGQRLMLACWS